MLLREIYAAAIPHWYLVLAAAIVVFFISNKFGQGINKYPGPFVASLTNWWRFFDAFSRKAHITHIKLHRQHGDVVRLGPNVLSFANPAAIKEIYGLNKGYVKTEFYPVQNNVSKGERLKSLFSSTDEVYHAKLRRHVNSAFSMSNLVSYEPLVNSTTSVFLEHTQKRFCETNEVCDFARWLQFYAFDVIGEITFSKRLGFIENFEDVDGIIAAIAGILSYSGPIGQMPWLDRYFLSKNPIKMFLMRKGLITASNPIAAFASSRSAQRRAEKEKLKAGDVGSESEGLQDTERGVDFLTRFLITQQKSPEFMTDERVLTNTVSLINAGSDTTAISLSAVFYYLLKNPRCYRKLMQELDTAVEDQTIDLGEDGVVSWADAQKLPYLDAVIQEAFRLYPAAGLLLERHVPPGGATICGERIPEHTIVGCNAWVIHRRPEVFGDQVDDFRPERWIEADAARLKDMKASMFQFGAGARTCIGRNISTLEMYKLVPSFLTKFEVELDDPEKEWTTLNCWFVRQEDFNARFKLRKKG